MKRILSILLALLLLVVAAVPSYAAGWSVSLTNRAISYLVVDVNNNNIVYAAGNDANQNVYVYRSTDGGLSWTNMSAGLGQFTVYSFADSSVRTEDLLIGGWDQIGHHGFVYQSTDSGQTWTNLSAKVENESAQAVHYGNDTQTTFFVGTDLHLWESYDGGDTFNSVLYGNCPSPNVHVIGGDNHNPGFMYFGLDAGTCGGLYVSPDDGHTLFASTNGLPGLNPTVSVLQVGVDTSNSVETCCPNNYNSSFLALVGVPANYKVQSGPITYSLWRTQDHGGLWQGVADTDPIYSIIWDSTNDNYVYYTTKDGLFQSTNQGNSFQWVAPTGVSGAVALMSNPSRIITGSASGVAVFDLTSGPIPQTLPATSNPAPETVAAVPGAPCQFVLGFKTLHDLASREIGDCIDNQTYDSSGDAVQHTTKGLLVWRPADNWTGFTNGYMTWINGPTGLVQRLNWHRFAWEANREATPVIPG